MSNHQNNSTARKLLDLASDGNTTAFIDEFSYQMAARIEPKLDQKRQEVSGNVFKSPIKMEEE